MECHESLLIPIAPHPFTTPGNLKYTNVFCRTDEHTAMVIAGSLLLAFGVLTTKMSVDVGEGSQTAGTVVHIVAVWEQTSIHFGRNRKI